MDRAIAGGNALLLVTGTPGSGRSHTLWGKLRWHGGSATAVAGAAPAPAGIERQGLLPLALADLAHRWRCGNGSPFFHSSAAGAGVGAGPAAAAAATPSFISSSSSSTAVTGTSPTPFSPSLAFQICVAEVLPCGDGGASNDEEGTTAASGATTRDLLRVSSSVPCPSSGGGGSVRGREAAGSSLSPRRWALSARDAIAGLTSSSLASVSPSRSSVGGSGLGSRSDTGGATGGGRNGAAGDRALLTSRVLVGVNEVRAGGIEEALSLIRNVSMQHSFF